MSGQSDCLIRLRALIAAYLDKVDELERNRKIGEGLFGMKGGPKDDPCHDRFAEDVRALLSDFAAEEPSSGETAALLRELYTAAADHRDAGCAYWMLLAVQGAGLPLIERLSAPDAAALHALLESLYSRRERFPVHDQTLKKLKKQGKS